MTKKQLDVLRECFLFCDSDNSELADILSTVSPVIRRYDAGELVYSPDDYERALGIVCKGKLDVYKRHEGNDSRKTLMKTITAGEIFGAAALFDSEDRPYVTYIKSHSVSEAIIITQNNVETLIKRYPRCAMNYIRFLSDRIRFLNGKIDSFTAGDAVMRLAHYLSALKSSEVHLNISLTKLANQLDIGRASLYRAIDALEKDGIISYCDKIFVIKKVALLNTYNKS